MSRPVTGDLRARLERLADTVDSYCDHEDNDPGCMDSLHALSDMIREEAAEIMAPIMSPALLAFLRALSEAATPGPWRRDTGVHDNVIRAEGDFEWVGVTGRRHDMPEPVFAGQVSNRYGQHVADAAFIVAMERFVRDLLAREEETRP